MKYAIIAKNRKYFWNHIQDRFTQEDVHKVYRSTCRIILKNGDELFYISSNEDFHGLRGVKVLMWSKPDWFDANITEQLAQMASRK
jgi:hypothetical protein